MSGLTPGDIYSAPRSSVLEDHSDGVRASRLGLVSLVLGTVGATSIVPFVLALVLASPALESDQISSNSPLISLGVLAIAACVSSLVGLCLAVVALRRPRHAQSRAVSGLLVNLGVLFVIAFLLIVGRMNLH